MQFQIGIRCLIESKILLTCLSSYILDIIFTIKYEFGNVMYLIKLRNLRISTMPVARQKELHPSHPKVVHSSKKKQKTPHHIVLRIPSYFATWYGPWGGDVLVGPRVCLVKDGNICVAGGRRVLAPDGCVSLVSETAFSIAPEIFDPLCPPPTVVWLVRPKQVDPLPTERGAEAPGGGLGARAAGWGRQLEDGEGRPAAGASAWESRRQSPFS